MFRSQYAVQPCFTGLHAVQQHPCKREAVNGVRENAAGVLFAPVECELRVQTTALADLFCQWPSLTRVDGVTLRFNAASVEHVVRMLNCLSAMSFMLR